jgi:hypothetical protein
VALYSGAQRCGQSELIRTDTRTAVALRRTASAISGRYCCGRVKTKLNLGIVDYRMIAQTAALYCATNACVSRL